MSHSELVGYLTSVVTEANKEADYQVDARDILNMLRPAPRAAPGEPPPPAEQQLAAPRDPQPKELFTQACNLPLTSVTDTHPNTSEVI
ncbi:hypothetical protein [Streptomyces sp. NPDC050988]|uniref:hypothetical protein n=1 Tax=Streptomyces sp. NPDC050988 TaxID=3365637 RepID=UPI003795FB0D